MRGFFSPSAILLLLVAGCGSGAMPAARAPWAGWAENAGGVVAGAEQVRAEAALARLGIGQAPTVCVRVLSNESLGAWTFPDGSMFVTRRLVAMLSEDELAAVLAHEAGHLRSAARLATGVAFDGALAPTGCEERADDEGRSILRSRSIPQAALISALTKVRDAASTLPSVRSALDARILRLTLLSRQDSGGCESLAGRARTGF